MTQTTLRPVKPATETVADISILGQYVHVSFLETNKHFKECIKELGYHWGGFNVGWERKCNSFTGSSLDRATETGIHLLKAGFIISIIDDKLKEKIINTDFEPEQKRWIVKRSEGEYTGWFAAFWEYGNEGIYDAFRSIAGSRWSNPSVVIPARHYEAVLDLAEKYSFEISQGAMWLIEKSKREREDALIVDMSETEIPVSKSHAKKEEIGIHASLRDDD